MSSGSSWGSSEYTQEAERLFAEYLSRRDAEEIEFEDFCAAHPELQEELFGLRADWDNVAGLVAELDALRPEPVEEPPRRAPASAAPAQVATRPSRLPLAAWLALAVVTLGLGGIALRTLRSKGALAAELHELDRAHRGVAGALERAEGERAALLREAEAMRGRQEALEHERDEAEGRAHAAEARARALSELRTLAELQVRARELWPALPERAAELEAWIRRAEELAELPEPDGAAAGPELQELARARAEVLDPGGVLETVRFRLAVARGLATGPTEVDSAAWGAARNGFARLFPEPEAAGLALPRQAGLTPLEPDARSGLPRFALLPTWDAAPRPGAAQRGDPGLVLQLVPGLVPLSAPDANFPLTGSPTPPFFLSEGPLSPEQARRLGAEGGLGLRPPTPQEWRLALLWGAVRPGRPARPVEAGVGSPLASPVEAAWEAAPPARSAWRVRPLAYR